MTNIVYTPKYLLFDFDGVLVDTMAVSYAAHLKHTGGNTPLQEYKKLFHGNIYSILNQQNKDPEFTMSADHLRYFEHYTPAMLEQVPIAGIPQILQDLARDHTLIVVSSTINGPIQQYLDRYNLSQYFNTIMGADTHASKTKKIRMVFDLYQAKPEECIFITDTLGDLREAEHAGIRSLAVSWGFHNRETLLQGTSVAIASDPQHLHQLIHSLHQ